MLYRFDDIDDRLELLPLASRRALDHAGIRLSREGWSSLPLPLRRQIVTLGANPFVDVELVRDAAALANPPAEQTEALADPPADSPPDEVREALGREMPISDAVWTQLSPLDRYALAKVASRGRPERLRAAYEEIVGTTSVSTHLGPRGGARMVDVGQKPATLRRAVSRTEVTMNAEAFERLRSNDVAKGDVLGVARLAGIMAAKRTSELIPLCHPLSLSKLSVEFELDDAARAVRVAGTVEAFDRTGVEVESLVAVSIAALTIYDMLKSVDRAIVIGPTRLVEKSGGRSGDYSS
ncbi:MAG TPA: cyclic pyranopterin monophosphate synthase MoaC [Polyangiaceae bacterium]|nr:cyclic pyranopterin monophosphate synthase MoaC [Polyangiaceae bacterium]